MSTSDPKVSFADSADAAAIRDLLREGASSFDVEAELRRSYARVWVVRTEEPRVLGVALTWEVADEVHLIDLMVEPMARRRGLGRALLSAVVSRAESGPFRIVLLEVRRDNEPARNLYDSLGFRQSGERENYYSDGEAAILMQRELHSGAR